MKKTIKWLLTPKQKGYIAPMDRGNTMFDNRTMVEMAAFIFILAGILSGILLINIFYA